jgi:hypothetical protein
MTRHTDAEQERASLGAFIDRAGRDGFDTAHTFFDCGEVVFLNPDTADLWGFWQAARRAPAAPVPQGLREAAQAVVERWDTPLWKDVPATAVYIADLRAALAAAPQPPANET